MTNLKRGIARRALLASAAAVGTSLALPKGVFAQTQPKRGGNLRWVVTLSPGTLDPLTSRNAGDYNALYLLYDALIDFDPTTLELKPGLAKAWRYTDAKTLVLDLDERVVFHDGTPMDAEAVKFNLERYRSDPRSNVKADIAAVEQVEITGPHQITLHLTGPNAAMTMVLTDKIGMMVSPTAIKAAKDGNMDRTPIGAGPFKLVTFQDNDHMAVVRHDKYHKPGLPYLDGMNMQIITDYSTALRAVVAGEHDIVSGLLPQQKPAAELAKQVVAELSPSTGMVGIFLNYGRPPLDNLKVRQALQYGVDRDAMNKLHGLGLEEPSSAILPKEHWACDPATANFYNYDPDKAKALLAEAGYPNGLDVPMVGWSDPTSMQWQELIINQLDKIGFRIKLTPVSNAQSSVLFHGPAKQGAGRMSLISSRPDPSQEYDNLFSKDAFFNSGGVELPGYRELLEATMTTTDQTARKAAFAKLQRFEVENGLILILVFLTYVNVRYPKVKGYVHGLIGKPKFNEVWLDA